MSLGGSSPSYALKSAIDNARAKGIIIVAAAGNSGDGYSRTVALMYSQATDA